MPPLLSTLALLALLSVPAHRPIQDGAGVRITPDPDVRLVVLISVDQLLPEQLERLAPVLRGGFARFLHGERHRRAFHDHADSSTGPGHATLGTGRWPSHNGIVGNTWSDRENGNAFVYCVADPTVGTLTPSGAGEPGPAGRSPRLLLTDGMADILRHASPQSRSIGIAGKDRAAILSTGHTADWALWWDTRNGDGFVSSTYYGEELPAWVLEFDANWWQRLPADGWNAAERGRDPRLGTAPDVRPGEAPSAFPYALPVALPEPSSDADRLPPRNVRAQLAAWTFSSPWLDLLTIRLAAHAVVELDLGGGPQVDYLFVGLSGCDITGHAHGPMSLEVTDLLLHADDGLELLFDLLDDRVGEGHWIAALSSDHGVLELPESLAARGFDAARLAPGSLDRAGQALGSDFEETFGHNYISGRSESGFLLDREQMRADGVDLDEVVARAKRVAPEILPRLLEMLSAADLEGAHGTAPEEGLARLMAHSFLAERSADLLPVLRPRTLAGFPYGTSHGSPWGYDRHVPLSFLGPGAHPGHDWRPCTTVDVVPTLLQRAGIPLPTGLDGSPLP